MGRVARDEAERFFSHVVRGPEPSDCWIWTGAISDDGYGRFWLNRNGRNVAVRPSRFAHTLTTGRVLPSSVMLLHTCDVPLCVHVDIDPALSHLYEGDARMNMLDRSQKGRARNRWNSLGWRGISRKQRVDRSRALRTAVLTYGWDRDRIRAALNGVDPATPALF